MKPALVFWLVPEAALFSATTVNMLVVGSMSTVNCCANSHVHSPPPGGGAPTYLSLRYNEKLLSTVSRTVAFCALFPAGVEKFLRNPTNPTAALVLAPAVDQIQLLAERSRGLGTGAGTVTLAPHGSEP